MPATASTSLDMRGKTITTFIAYAAARRLTELAEGETLELLTDASDAIDNDIRAWCRATEQELASTGHSDGTYRYAITKASLPPQPGRRLAAVISDPGLEDLLSRSGLPWPPSLRVPASRCTSRDRRYAYWSKGSPRSCTARAGPSAGSPGPARYRCREGRPR